MSAHIREITEERRRFEKSPEREALEAFFKTQPPGASLSWVEIERVTGVRLGKDVDGMRHRRLVEDACRAAGHKAAYIPRPDWGIDLVGPANLFEKTRHRNKRILGQNRRAKREASACVALAEDEQTKKFFEVRRDTLGVIIHAQTSDLGALPSPPSRMDQKPMLPQAKSKAKDA